MSRPMQSPPRRDPQDLLARRIVGALFVLFGVLAIATIGPMSPGAGIWMMVALVATIVGVVACFGPVDDDVPPRR